jgi:hypothetical protein
MNDVDKLTLTATSTFLPLIVYFNNKRTGKHLIMIVESNILTYRNIGN